jgi:hypothetical protein
MMHRALVAARTGDATLARHLLLNVLRNGYLVAPNLSTRHYPYRMPYPDALLSLPTLLTEMIVQSRPGEVDVLPALPNELSSGTIEQISLRCCAVLDRLQWSLVDRSLVMVIRPLDSRTISLAVRVESTSWTMASAKGCSWEQVTSGRWRVDLEQGTRAEREITG